MTEQPNERGLFIRVTHHQAAHALAAFSIVQDKAVDTTLARVSLTDPHLDRIAAEDHARRLIMSACLCRALGVGPDADEILFTRKGWQELLTKLLFTYDKTDLSEVEGQ